MSGMTSSLSPLKEPSRWSSYSSPVVPSLPGSCMRCFFLCGPSSCFGQLGTAGRPVTSSSASSSSSSDEGASALPLKASSTVDVDVRPWEKFEASPRRISCSATSSSEMTLLMVGSGVGRIPSPERRGGGKTVLLGRAPRNCLGGCE
jgi:hypothetical protein